MLTRINLKTRIPYLVLITILLYGSSCKNKEHYHLQETIVRLKKIAVDTSYVTIPIDSNRSFDYKIFSVSRDGIYCGYNPSKHSLDFFDLKKNAPLHQIHYDKDHNPLKYLRGMFVQNMDSIYLLTTDNILLINAKGDLKTSNKINNSAFDPFFKENYLTNIDRKHTFQYNPTSKGVYASSLNITEPTCGTGRYFYSPIAELSQPKLKKITALNLKFSELYRENEYGFMNTVQFVFTNDGKKIIYNFPIEPNIYVYDLSSKTSTVFGGTPPIEGLKNNEIASKLDESFCNNDDKKILHLFDNPIYYGLITDLKGEFYYRINSLALDYNNSTNKDFSAKKRYLTIFNKSFEVIYVCDLNDRNYILDGAFCTSDGLMIPAPRGNQSLSFKLFKFNHK